LSFFRGTITNINTLKTIIVKTDGVIGVSGETLNVSTGTTTLAGTLGVGGNTKIAGTLDISGNTAITGTLAAKTLNLKDVLLQLGLFVNSDINDYNVILYNPIKQTICSVPMVYFSTATTTTTTTTL
jgi:hypothetical protein